MGPPGPYGTAYQPAGPAQRTNTLAIIALICSIGGLITIISAPIGIVLGHIAKRQIAQTGEEGGGMATAALIVGYILTGLALAACCGFAVLVITAAVQSSS